MATRKAMVVFPPLSFQTHRLVCKRSSATSATLKLKEQSSFPFTLTFNPSKDTNSFDPPIAHECGHLSVKIGKMNENSRLFRCSLSAMVESFVATETQMDVKVELGGNFWFLLSVLYTAPYHTWRNGATIHKTCISEARAQQLRVALKAVRVYQCRQTQ